MRVTYAKISQCVAVFPNIYHFLLNSISRSHYYLQQRCTWLTFCQKMEGWVGTCFTMANTFFNIFSTNFYKIFILGRFVCFTIHIHSIYLKWVWLFFLFFLYIYYTMMMSYRLIFCFFFGFFYAYLLNSNDLLQADIQTQSYDQG